VIYIHKKLFILVFAIALIFVGLVYSVLPHGVRYTTLEAQGERYIPLTQESYFDVMNVHGARYREMVDGNVFMSDVDTYEYKDGPSLWPPLSASLLAPFFMPFETIFPGMLITDLFFPLLTFLAFFFVIFALTRSKWYALGAGYILMLFPVLPTLIPPTSLIELKMILAHFVPSLGGSTIPDLTYLARESMIPGAPFFILTLYFIYRAMRESTEQKKIILAGGVFYGLLFYLYFFYWVFVTIFLGMLFLVLASTKRFSSAGRIVALTLVGGVVSLPFWINQYSISQLPNSFDLIERIGIEVGHGVKWFLWKSYALFAGMAAVSLWFGRRLGLAYQGWFLAALSVTGIISLNANVLTGFFPQSDHWNGRVFLITNGIIFSALLYYMYVLFERHFPQRYTNGVFAVIFFTIAVALTGNVVVAQVKYERENARYYTVSEELMSAYEWLNQNTPPDSVVMTPSIKTNVDIPAYTHNRIYLARAYTTLAQEKEILERMYYTYTLFGMGPEELYFMMDDSHWVNYFLGAKYRYQSLDRYLKPDKYEEAERVLSEVLKARIINDFVVYHTSNKKPTYKLDYILVDNSDVEHHVKTAENFNDIRKIYDKDGVMLYKVIE
jgi:hypothetical protein